MDNNLYSFALKNTLDEIRNLCPQVSNAFVFTEDGEITAAYESTPEEKIVRVIDAFEDMIDNPETMGGIDTMTIEGSKGGVNVSHVGHHYFVTSTSENADKNYVNTLTRTIVTTVLKLLDKISPAPLKNNPAETGASPETFIEHEESAEQPVPTPIVKEAEEPRPIRNEYARHEPTANQFMVENIEGLLVPADTVRVDRETLLQWQSLYEDQKIKEVEVETFPGQSTRCKIKPIKDSKQEGKGIIQMPQRIQQTLEVRKGELVKVKPIVEHEGDEP